MKRKGLALLLISFICGAAAFGTPAAAETARPEGYDAPVLILVVDKLDARQLWNSPRPAVRRLLSVSACGLMNVRSAIGHNHTESGYLSIGAGNRAFYPGNSAVTYESGAAFSGDAAWGDYLQWARPELPIFKSGLIVPEIGWIRRQAESEDRLVHPGALGTALRENGWQTYILGSQESRMRPLCPAGLLLMDKNGRIDGGDISSRLFEADPDFPYLLRLRINTALGELERLAGPRRVIALDFGDFARLDQHREEFTPEQYYHMNERAWDRLALLLDGVMARWPVEKLRLLMISPSISREGVFTRNLLAPVVIRTREFPPGIIHSNSTKWDGIMTNTDLLPFILRITDSELSRHSAEGLAVISAAKAPEVLTELTERIAVITFNQRGLLDWLLGVITIGWLAALGFAFLRRERIGSWGLSLVGAAPLALLLLALAPLSFWQPWPFLLAAVLISASLAFIRGDERRWTILSGTIVAVVLIDQLSGWNLMRFSALGYSAVGGSRYYGIGNECMGLLLAAGLLAADYLRRTTGRNWPAAILLLLLTISMGWPALGANFGGLLAALAGFGCYVYCLYRERFHPVYLWLGVAAVAVSVLLVGWWDSLRDPELQTHIGRFFGIIFARDFGATHQVIMRKLEMNLKLIVFSPWTRILLLALAITMANRLFSRQPLVAAADRLFSRGLLVAGIAALVFNDSGVVAFAVCIAFGFSYLLCRRIETASRVEGKIKG